MRFFLIWMAFFSIVWTLFSGGYYLYIKEDISQKSTIEQDFLYREVVAISQKAVAENAFDSFAQLIQILQQNTSLRDVNLSMKRYIFDENFLRKKISFSNPMLVKASITDVTIDSEFGDLEELGENRYILKLNEEAQKREYIYLKFQVVHNEFIQDFLIPFYLQKSLARHTKTDNLIHKEFQTDDFILSIYTDTTIQYADVLNKTLQQGAMLFLFSIIMTLMTYFLYRRLIRQNLTSSITQLNDYLKQILEGKMIKDSSLQISFKELSELYLNTLELTKRYVNASNELAISKDIIFQKERSDELTGLPNKKSFENDLKYMFISNKNGYIIYFKIEKIGLFTKNYGPEIVDALIDDFAKTILHYFTTYKKITGNIYRFFGGEFAIIVYASEISLIESSLKEIIELTNTLTDKYYFFDRAVYYGATPFDHYGTIESIVQSAQDAYEIALKAKTPSYYIIDAQQQLLLNAKLEDTVKDIIKRNDFVLQYLYDTFSFDTTPRLLFQEVSPLLIDSFTYETIPSGKFISIAEKLGVVIDFDKALIEKVLEQIELGELTHKIGVVLSITSLSNYSFMTWLESLIITNPAMKYIVFSSPAYSVASNNEVFVNFNSLLKKYGIEMMIKKYDPVDLSLDSLEKIMPTYLRIERSLCQDFKKDSTKQHAIKQILLFTERYNIKVFGDSVKNEQDYAAFEMLGLYGTSQ